MSASLQAFNVTGFELKGADDAALQGIRVFVDGGQLAVHIELCMSGPRQARQAFQLFSPAQARAMARRLFALADEVDTPRDPMDGPGRKPLGAPIW